MLIRSQQQQQQQQQQQLNVALQQQQQQQMNGMDVSYSDEDMLQHQFLPTNS